jgi:hypothetical protein
VRSGQHTCGVSDVCAVPALNSTSRIRVLWPCRYATAADCSALSACPAACKADSRSTSSLARRTTLSYETNASDDDDLDSAEPVPAPAPAPVLSVDSAVCKRWAKASPGASVVAVGGAVAMAAARLLAAASARAMR